MSDDEPSALVWAARGPRAPTRDEANTLANTLAEFSAAFGEDAVRHIVKRVLGARRGRPPSDVVRAENAELLAEFRAAQAGDEGVTMASFAKDHVQEWADHSPLEKRLQRIVAEDKQDRRLWDVIMSADPADEDETWLEECDPAAPGDNNSG